MIDFHTHILPFIDDGSSSVEESLQLLVELQRQGVTKVILTPHYDEANGSVDDFIARRQKSYDAMKDIVPEGMELILGAEFYFSSKNYNYQEYRKLCIQNTDFLLIEPKNDLVFSNRFFDNLEDLMHSTGVIPIIAHADRYIAVKTDPMVLTRFILTGCLIEVSANSLLDFSSRRLSRLMVKKGLAHAIGSDCHNMNNRKPKYDLSIDFIKRRIGKKRVEYLQASMQKILDNSEFKVKYATIRKIGGIYF